MAWHQRSEIGLWTWVRAWRHGRGHGGHGGCGWWVGVDRRDAFGGNLGRVVAMAIVWVSLGFASVAVCALDLRRVGLTRPPSGAVQLLFGAEASNADS
jgi:hypothetical protein